jgi:hypothetical protein
MNIKEITLPDSWIIDKQEGNKLILKEDLTKLNTWESCFDKLFSEQGLRVIDSEGFFALPHVKMKHKSVGKTIIPVEYTYSMLALMQLLVCYKAWIGDWKPDWENDWESDPYKFYIRADMYRITLGATKNEWHIFTFPTEEMANRFLDTFKALLEKAKPLL